MTANTVGATLLNTPIQNTPMSIVALNSQFIQDVGALEPNVAATYVAGVSGAAAPGTQLVIRGQDISLFNMRDGITDYGAGFGGVPANDTSLEERLEIIKGPEGTLYGSNSGQGGLMNVVTKAPQPADATSLIAIVGADEFGGTIYRQELDMTGTFSGNQNLEYRLIVVGQEGKSLQNVPDTTFVLSPMLKYRLKGNGTILLRYIYQNPNRPINNEQWFADAGGNISTFIPAKYDTSDANATRNLKTHTVDFEYNQPFSTGPIDWQGRLYFRYNHADDDNHYYNVTASTLLFLNAAGQTIGNQNNTLFSNPNFATLYAPERSVTEDADYLEAAQTHLALVGNFDVGPAKNELLLFGYSLRESLDQYAWAGPTYPGMILWSNVPGLAPVHQQNPAVADSLASIALATDTDVISTLLAAGAQDNISFLDDKIIFVLGIRDDRSAATTFNRFANTEIPDDIRKGVTHKYGTVVHPLPFLGLFYNYAQTFAPQGYTNNILGQSVKLPNLFSTTEEEGAKFNLFNNRLVVTASYFDTKVADETVLVAAVNSLNQQVSLTVPAGEAVIKGWEFDGTVVLSDNLDVLFGAGNLTSKTQTGLLARAVPIGTDYKAFARYTFTNQALKGLFIGAGLQHNGAEAATSNASFFLFPYTVYNGVIGYSFGRHWRAQINVNNLTNAVYATASTNNDFIYASIPRDCLGTLTYSF